MLTLADSRELDGASVYRDVSWAGGSRSLTSTFYVLGSAPALAAASDGSPGYQFYLYRGVPHGESGGLLTVTVTAMPTTTDDLATQIRAAYGLDAAAQVVLAPAPVSAATVSLTFAGEGPTSGVAAGAAASDASLAPSVLGGGGAGQVGAEHTSFAVALTTDGAALLDQAITDDLAVLGAEYDLVIPYVLDDITVHVWCDTRAACQVAADLAAAGSVDPAALVRSIQARQLAGSTTTCDRVLTPAEQAGLDAFRTAVLADLIPTGLLDAAGNPRPYTDEVNDQLNVTLGATYPGAVSASLTANLTLPGGTGASGHVTVADLAADTLLRRLEVTLVGDLTALGLASVVARIGYHGSLPSGAALVRDAEVLLDARTSTGVAQFDLAAADQRTVSVQLEVHPADGSAPYEIALPDQDGDVLVIDASALGALAVSVNLGAVDPSLGASAVVDFAYPSLPGVSGTVVLDSGQPAAQWTALVKQAQPGPYQWRVTWTAGQLRLAGDWTPDTRQRLVLDAPAALTPPTSTVQFFSAGHFDGLSAIVVEIRAAETDPVTALTFTAPDQTQSWTGPRPLTYELRQTLVPADGSAPRVGSWSPDDKPVRVVRDDLRMDVDVLGELLGLGSVIRRAVVQVQGPVPGSQVQTVVLGADAVQGSCTVALVDAADTTYQYRLLVSPLTGTDTVGPWLTSSSTVLVLRPNH